jgi:hypothetical protein
LLRAYGSSARAMTDNIKAADRTKAKLTNGQFRCGREGACFILPP